MIKNTALTLVFGLIARALNNRQFQAVAYKAVRIATKQLIHIVGRYARRKHDDYRFRPQL